MKTNKYFYHISYYHYVATQLQLIIIIIIIIIISRSFILRMRNISDKSCREIQNSYFVFSKNYFENLAVYEIMWKNILERGRQQMTIWRMRIACWIPKATNTHIQVFLNNYRFSTETMVARTRLNVMLYVHCLSCQKKLSLKDISAEI
jgi:hypothetical protein